jgi:uncharacterized Tic20 family protein
MIKKVSSEDQLQNIYTPSLSEDEKNWAMFCHLASFAGFIIPFGNIIGPLIVWLIKGKESEFVDAHGKESLNFQISMTIYFCVSFVLIFLLIGIPLIIILAIVQIILVVIASMKARDGLSYQYPITIRFL